MPGELGLDVGELAGPAQDDGQLLLRGPQVGLPGLPQSQTRLPSPAISSSSRDLAGPAGGPTQGLRQGHRQEQPGIQGET